MRMTTRLLTAVATVSLAGGMALATVPTAMAASASTTPTECTAAIAGSHIHLWASPGGVAVKNNKQTSTQNGDPFVSLPKTESGSVAGQTWYKGSDTRTGNSGWVGANYLSTLKCFPVKAHRHRHRKCHTKTCHR